MDVTLKQGDSLSVEVRNYTNLLPYIETKVVGNTLVIDNDGWLSHSDGVVMITIPTLSSVDLVGSGNINTVGTFNFNDLGIYIGGSGDFSLSGTCKNLNTKITGSGEIHAFNLPTDNVNVVLAGSGNLKLNVLRSLDVSITGSGDVIYKGNPSVNMRVTGSGQVRRY
jgi:Putative auto-transporter adhesin, head GIN domain